MVVISGWSIALLGVVCTHGTGTSLKYDHVKLDRDPPCPHLCARRPALCARRPVLFASVPVRHGAKFLCDPSLCIRKVKQTFVRSKGTAKTYYKTNGCLQRDTGTLQPECLHDPIQSGFESGAPWGCYGKTFSVMPLCLASAPWGCYGKLSDVMPPQLDS